MKISVVRSSYSGKPGTVRLPSIETANGVTSPCGKFAVRTQQDNYNICQRGNSTNEVHKKCQIDQQLMSTIRVDIEKMKEISSTISRYNHSYLLKHIQLHTNIDKLEELFLPFLRDALTYFTSPNSFYNNNTNPYNNTNNVTNNNSYNIHNNSVANDRTFITSAAVRSSSFSFLQQWKIIISIVDAIRERGIGSILDYINEQFDFIYSGLQKIADKPQRHTALFTLINKSHDILCNSLRDNQNRIAQLFESFSDPTSESLTVYITEIRGFLSLFNETFYNVFPKAGLMPLELSGIKSDTLAATNEIMTSLRALFSFWSDFRGLTQLRDEIQRLLDSIICQTHLPAAMLRIVQTPKVAPEAARNDDSISAASYEVSDSANDFSNEITKKDKKNRKNSNTKDLEKVDQFIKELYGILDKPQPIDPTLGIWERLRKAGKAVSRSLGEAKEAATKVKASRSQMHLMSLESDNKQKRIEELQMRNAELMFKNQELTESLEETLKKLKEKEEIIREDFSNKEKKQEEKCLEKVSLKLNDMMNKTDLAVAQMDQKNTELTSLEKVNVFVLEKRCSKCKEFENQRKEILKMLAPFVDIRKGESLASMIKSVVKKHESIEAKIAQVEAEAEEAKYHLQKFKDATSSILEKSGSKRLRKHGQNPDDVSESLLQSFNDIEKKFKSELDNMESDLKDSHAKEMGAILKTLYTAVSDDDDDDNNLNGQKDLKEIIMEKVKKAVKKIKTMEKQQEATDKILDKVKKWMNDQVGQVNCGELDFEKAFSVLMEAIDNKENPLQPQLNRLEYEAKSVLEEVRTFADNMNKMKGIDRIETRHLGTNELILAAERNAAKLYNMLESSESVIQTQTLEMESNKDIIQAIAGRLHRLLQLGNNVDFSAMDMNELMNQVSNYVEELISGGTQQLFVSIADLNEMSRNARKYSKFPNSSDPKTYLPDILEKYFADEDSLRIALKFEEPLEAIFKNFDFQLSSYHPDQKAFKFLREKIFQMHLLLGKDDSIIQDPHINNIFKRFVSLASTFFSYIASSFLEVAEREHVYAQQLNQNKK